MDYTDLKDGDLVLVRSRAVPEVTPSIARWMASTYDDGYGWFEFFGTEETDGPGDYEVLARLVAVQEDELDQLRRQITRRQRLLLVEVR